MKGGTEDALTENIMAATVTTNPNAYTTQIADADGFKAAQIVQHDDGGCVARFGYADTTIRKGFNSMAMPTVIEGQFEECHGTPSRTYKTRAGAERACCKWVQ